MGIAAAAITTLAIYLGTGFTAGQGGTKVAAFMAAFFIAMLLFMVVVSFIMSFICSKAFIHFSTVVISF